MMKLKQVFKQVAQTTIAEKEYKAKIYPCGIVVKGGAHSKRLSSERHLFIVYQYKVNLISKLDIFIIIT